MHIDLEDVGYSHLLTLSAILFYFGQNILDSHVPEADCNYRLY